MEVYKEAHLLALQLESRSRSWAAQAAGPQGAASQENVERFIQESELKMNLFEKENKTRKSPNSLKRETYYLSDSPLGAPQLSGTQPPSGQGPLSPRPLPVEAGPVHPPNLAVTQKKAVSRLLPPRASSSVRGKSTRVAVEEVGRAGGVRQSLPLSLLGLAGSGDFMGTDSQVEWLGGHSSGRTVTGGWAWGGHGQGRHADVMT